MSLLASQHRHLALAQRALPVLRVGQVRMAGKQAAPQQKQAQSIGGVKKGRKEKWETKIAQERTHRSRDIPIYTKLSEDKLKTPKTKERPAVLPEPFQAGIGHSLKLPLFEPKALTPKNVGKAVGYNTSPSNAAKVFGLPNKMFLEYRILSSPATVIRDVTLEAISAFEAAKGTPSADSRIVLHGRAGCGKSFLLHQLVQYAQSQGHVVLYIPRASTLVNSTTSYTYDPRTQTYVQPHASYTTLTKLYAANAAILDSLPLQNSVVAEKWSLEKGDGVTVGDLVKAGLKDKSHGRAVVALEAVMKELEVQTQKSVLFAVDDLQAVYGESMYRDPFFEPIRAHHLSLPRLILEYASGKRSFAKGMFVGALTASDTTYTVPLELRDALGLAHPHPVTPYEKRDQTVLDYAKGLRGMAVPMRMSKEEMAGLYGVWKDDLALTSGKHDELFLSKYVESDGNPRDFVWKGLLSTFST